jgi:cytoskeletal protein CcmA (bactofilin family)
MISKDIPSMATPIPPKRTYKNRTESPRVENVVVGTGFQLARAMQKPPVPITLPTDSQLIKKLQEIDPDVVIGTDVEIKGNFQFDGLLRLEGRFQGQLQSTGDLIVGPGGILITDVHDIKRMWIDSGRVVGKINVEHLAVSGKAVIQGDITCKHFEMQGQDAIIEGSANIHPFAPAELEEGESSPRSIPSQQVSK